MHLSHSFPGRATLTGHRWLIASLCFSIVLHGLLAIIHSRLPTDADSSPVPTRLTVVLQHARQARASLSTANTPAVRDISVPSSTRGRRVNTQSDRRLPPANQTSVRMAETPADTGSASVSPSIDLEAAREIARQTVRSQPAAKARTVQNTTDATEPETVLGRKISRAALPDCRTAYAGAGLLAIPLLLKDAVSDGGCTW